MKRVYIETYGCSANQAHSELMEGQLEGNGFRVVEKPDKADVIVINTCIVKTPTENKIRDRIRFLVRNYAGKKLVIAGCASDVGMFRDIAPKAEFLSSHRSKDIIRLIGGKKETEGVKRINPIIGITEIASGCLGNCSYCIVKLARGNLKSRKTGDVIKDVKKSVEEGCREIWITSQDCGCYGNDIGTNLAELLESVAGIKGEFRIRVGMMNPAHLKQMIKRLIEVYNHPKIYKFVHIPVQSGSDRILERMRRGYEVRDFERIAGEFREAIPGVTISTDVIAGFPGETEGDFRKTLELLERVKPDVVNVSKFGSRPGTEASRMEKVDNKVIKERSKKLAALVGKISMEKNREWVSKECRILVNEKGKKERQFVGRNGSYKPVIVRSEEDVMGKLLEVRVTKSGLTHLDAKLIRN